MARQLFCGRIIVVLFNHIESHIPCSCRLCTGYYPEQVILVELLVTLYPPVAQLVLTALEVGFASQSQVQAAGQSPSTTTAT